MAGFGSFMEGLQGGIGTMQSVRRGKQVEQLYDQELTLGEDKIRGRNYSLGRAGQKPLKRFGMKDPFLLRWMDKLGRGTGATESPVADDFPAAGEEEPPPIQADVEVDIPEVDPSVFGEAPDFAAADGGIPLKFESGGTAAEAALRQQALDDQQLIDELNRNEDRPRQQQPKGRYSVDSREEVQRRAAASRARTGTPPPREAVPTQVQDRTPQGKAQASAATAAEAAAAAPKGRLARVAGSAKGLAKGLLAGQFAAAGVGAALENGLNGDEKLAEYYRRINRPGRENDATPWRHAGVRAMGVLQDVGSAFLPDSVESKLFPYMGEAEQAPEAIPTQSSGPTRRYSARRTPDAPARPAAAPGAIPAGPAVPQEADPLAGFDVSQVSADDVPNFSNNEWIQFRDENIQEMVANGMSYAEAWDKVDQQTIATQRRGFLHFASQADALLAANNTRGAAAAVRAAFQYMPSTTDLKVGEYNGHVVAFSVNEETGEQVGTPIVVTPDLLQKIQLNFKDPAVWAEYAQDRVKLDQAERELGQTDTRLDLMRQGLEVDQENAMSSRIRAMGGGGGEGGMKLADADRHTMLFEAKTMEIMGEIGVDDPALADSIVAVMSSLYREGGGQYAPEVIARQVKALARTPEGLAKIRAAADSLAGG